MTTPSTPTDIIEEPRNEDFGDALAYTLIGFDMAKGEIPEDILKAAEAALDNLLCNCEESCGGIGGVRKASIHDIAEAILAERDRCAKIAERATRGGEIITAAALIAMRIRGEA